MIQTRMRKGVSFTVRTNEELVKRVLELRAKGITDTFWTTDQRGRYIWVTRRSSADLYQRMMAAKGVTIQLGAA